MTMDFSHLHTYTPPQCAPENTGYTYSLSSSYLTAALEFEKEHQIAPVFDSPRMSRRSLRLQTGAGLYANNSLADYSQNHSSSSVSYSSNRREARTVRSRKQQSSSSSKSLSLSQANTPRKALSFSATNTPISSDAVHQSNTASDASLLTSITDQTGLRQRTTTTTTTTTVNRYWGSSQDAEVTGRSSSMDHSSSGVNGDASASVSKCHSTVVNGYICKDCSIHSHRTDALTTHSSSSSSLQAAEAASGAFSFSSSPSSSIYSRDKSRRNKTGVLMSMSNRCMGYSRRALAPIVSLVTLLFNSVLWLGSGAKSPPGKGVLASFSDSMRRAVSSSVSNLWLLKQSTLHRMMGHKAKGYEGEAHSSFCGSMNVKDLVTGDASHLDLNGSLCDDCKGKQYSETHTVLHAQSSRPRRLAGALWGLLAYTASCLLQPAYCVARKAKAVGSGAGTVVRRLLSLLWLLLVAPVKAGRGLLWFLAIGWYQLVSLVSLLNVFFLTRCLPKLWKLLLLLLPLLLLLALWLWGPSTAVLLAYLPAINLTEWRAVSPLPLLSNLVPASAPVPASVPTPATMLDHTPTTPVSPAPPVLPPVVVSSLDLERLERVERQLTLLWEKVQEGDQRRELHHKDTLGLYNSLKEQLHTQTDRESLGIWVSSLLEQRLSLLRGELELENTERAKSDGEHRQQQQSQAARLAEVEKLLTLLVAKTEKVQQRQQQYEEKEEKEKEAASPSPTPPPVSVGVKQEDHDALLTEVHRLEAELTRIRQDLQGVLGCKGKCEQLDTLHEMVSAQVSAQVSSQMRKELQVLFFGSGQTEEGQGEVPEALIHWLSQRYVSVPDLQALLASLELSILRNVSLQLEQTRAQTLVEAEAQSKTISQTVTKSVQHTATVAGMTEEQVQLIVQNALKLYSQDRTGLVDYALESGGGSILSTRCSETYETKTALMSLFGLPLWYFSQSPRVVIQPDVYPGNCWAFKGSQGYLVIRLSLRILPTAFCLEHISKALSPTGNITSAPRNFTVFGLDDEYQEEGKLLGHYTYQEDGDSLQTFPVMEQNDKAFQIIEVRVLTNWGHPEYTCLYRFRVHGEPRPQ
ncbi:SUN domain-containing protein 1 isoform X2 [Lampris incognitus]|nr:SUN domain-containing protein 1 isoform X2 [Lampris incognitus]XP_056144764.1 SUN domain-containing protein 1 isoform X2 [Lampris incognitus]XP_056144765.1 SUN domain-containing protein 1 isoform X2 [Lampris incognitus]